MVGGIMDDDLYAPPKSEVADVPKRTSHASIPSLLGYSIILPVIWISLGLLMSVVFPGKRLGTGGLVLVVITAVILVSWLFVRKRHRQFTGRELWILVGCCSLWAGLCELSGIAYAVETQIINASQSGAIRFAVLFSLAVDSFYIWLGFRFSGRRFINWYIAKYPRNPR
jgi:drug/metabolite transporter (DMT)-like permease